MFSFMRKGLTSILLKFGKFGEGSLAKSHGINMSANSQYSSFYFKNPKRLRPDILYASVALMISLGGVAYEVLSSKQQEKEENENKQSIIQKLTKKDAKVLLEQAIKLDEQGENTKALELYNSAYRVYRRANKASDKKLTFMRQRIAILLSFEGRDKRAVLSLMEGFESVKIETLNEKLHFELYFDLCVLYYRFAQFIPSASMFQSCLNLAKITYPDDLEILTAIHQFLGFANYKRGKIQTSERHLTQALKYLNEIKKENKPFLYYACNEFCDFYTMVGDYKKALLFLEEAKIVLNQDSFFNPENIEKAMKIHSPYLQKYIKDLRKETETKKLESKSRMLRYKLGNYKLNNTKKIFHSIS